MGLIKNFNKTIHQMWWQGQKDFKSRAITIKPQNSIEEYLSLEECQKTYIDFCNSSDWSYNFWDEHKSIDLVKQEFPKYYESFQKIPTVIVKCDCVRAMIMHTYGGMYADLDTYLTKNLDDFFQANYLEYNTKEFGVYQNPQHGISERIKTQNNYMAIFTQEPYIYEYYYNLYGIRLNKISNAVMFSSKEYSLWIDLLEAGFSRSKNLLPLDYFGPNTLSMIVNKKIIENTEKLIQKGHLRLKDGNELCKSNSGVEVLITPKEYFQQTRKIDNPNQYVVHKFEGSWMPK